MTAKKYRTAQCQVCYATVRIRATDGLLMAHKRWDWATGMKPCGGSLMEPSLAHINPEPK